MKDISEFGITIKNIKAGMVYDTNIGVRDTYRMEDERHK
nr:MAG TPA: hypothetical protein [Caudoviricetes sp.]